MKKFIQQFNEKISGVISCFDRMLFKGYLPLGWPGAMEGVLARQGLRIMEFKPFVMKHSERIKTHAEAVAARHEWLARKLDAFDVRLEAGHVILPGSCTRAFDVRPGSLARADFDGLGPVEVRFG